MTTFAAIIAALASVWLVIRHEQNRKTERDVRSLYQRAYNELPSKDEVREVRFYPVKVTVKNARERHAAETLVYNGKARPGDSANQYIITIDRRHLISRGRN
jgi:hypothetical protein